MINEEMMRLLQQLINNNQYAIDSIVSSSIKHNFKLKFPQLIQHLQSQKIILYQFERANLEQADIDLCTAYYKNRLKELFRLKLIQLSSSKKEALRSYLRNMEKNIFEKIVKTQFINLISKIFKEFTRYLMVKCSFNVDKNGEKELFKYWTDHSKNQEKPVPISPKPNYKPRLKYSTKKKEIKQQPKTRITSNKKTSWSGSVFKPDLPFDRDCYYWKSLRPGSIKTLSHFKVWPRQSLTLRLWEQKDQVYQSRGLIPTFSIKSNVRYKSPNNLSEYPAKAFINYNQIFNRELQQQLREGRKRISSN